MPMKTVKKEWGAEHWFAQEPEYEGKVLIFQKDKSTSLHYHEKKKETLCVWAGKILLELDNIKANLEEGHTVTINPGQKHRITAIYNHAVILEVSTSEMNDQVKIE